MSVGDLLYSDTEDALRDSVRHLFADRCPPESVVRAYDREPQDFSDIWRTLAAAGPVNRRFLHRANRWRLTTTHLGKWSMRPPFRC